MRRILFLEHNVDGTIGGSHFCLLEICRALDRDRFTPVVWFFQNNPLVDEFRAAGAEVHIGLPTAPYKMRAVRLPLVKQVVSAAQSLANLYRVLVSSKAWWQRELKRLRIDIVHLNNSANGDFDLVLAAHSLGVPVVAHQRGFPARFDAIGRRVARIHDRVIAISSAVRADLTAKGIDDRKIKLIWDGIDPQKTLVRSNEQVPEEITNLAAHRPMIGIVGNVKRWKGQIVLVQAMQRIRRVFPNAHCVLVGSLADGKYVDEIQALIRAQSLESAVTLAGYQRNPIVWMNHFDIVIHTSVEPEPFGIVILEAMALGKPVIATDLGGPKETVAEGVSGFLVPPSDSERLAQRVLEVLSDRTAAAKLGENGRARLAAQFTAQQNVKQIEAIYTELLHRAASKESAA